MKPELRKDPITGAWVIVAADRSRRPNPFRHHPARVEEDGPCPFCPGHEAMTPGEVLAYRDGGGPDEPGWRVRVIPNLYPALRVEEDLAPRGEGLYDRMGGLGAHEVLIESPDHALDTFERPVEGVAEMLRAYRDRMADLYRDTRLRYVLAFKNRGAAAGATRDHPHGQIIAMPIVPPRIERGLAGAERYHDFRGRCVWCDMVAQELTDGRRLIVQNADFVAFAPYESRFPFEVMILPRRHLSIYRESDDRDLFAVAELLRDVLRRYALCLREPAYNFVIHSAPRDHTRLDAFHWHLLLSPKLVQSAGFEWGTDVHINPMPPEEAASFLRNLDQVMDVPAGYLLDS